MHDRNSRKWQKMAWRTLLAGFSVLSAFGPAQAQDAQTKVFLGAGLVHLRCPPRLGLFSLEANRISGGGIFGGWASLDGTPKDGFVGAGPLVRLGLGEHMALLVGTGPGICSNHAAAKLGFRYQYRSALTLSCDLPENQTLALSVSHYSNGGMSSTNPGSEGIRILYGMRI